MMIVFSSGTTASAEDSPTRTGYTGGVIQFPEGELKLGDVTCWTKSGLTTGSAVYEGNPNVAEGNWNLIVISSEVGAKMEAKRLQTSDSANFVNLVDADQKKVWMVPFQAICSIRVAKTEIKEVQNLTRIEEVFGRFCFLSTASTMKDFQASLELTLLHQLPAGGRSVKGVTVATLQILTEKGEWRDIPWSQVSAVQFQRDESEKTPSEVPPYLYRQQGGYSNVWKEYQVPEPKEEEKAGIFLPDRLY